MARRGATGQDEKSLILASQEDAAHAHAAAAAADRQSVDRHPVCAISGGGGGAQRCNMYKILE